MRSSPCDFLLKVRQNKVAPALIGGKARRGEAQSCGSHLLARGSVPECRNKVIQQGHGHTYWASTDTYPMRMPYFSEMDARFLGKSCGMTSRTNICRGHLLTFGPRNRLTGDTNASQGPSSRKSWARKPSLSRSHHVGTTISTFTDAVSGQEAKIESGESSQITPMELQKASISAHRRIVETRSSRGGTSMLAFIRRSLKL